jgi:ABC-type protease/lipase transport system fused ATPase/permease subunit
MLKFIAQFRRFFLFAGLFSLVINLLLIVPAVYMLQVFDRVMTSRSQETLVMLTLFTVVALVVMAALDFVRSQLLARGAVALDKTLGPIVLREMLAGRSRPTPDDAQHARGTAEIRSHAIRLGSPGSAVSTQQGRSPDVAAAVSSHDHAQLEHQHRSRRGRRV